VNSNQGAQGAHVEDDSEAEVQEAEDDFEADDATAESFSCQLLEQAN
jgi:hypothetical protein